MKENEAKISCPTFQKQEKAIRIITDKINATEKVEGKAVLAEELIKETDVLFGCGEAGSSSDCKNCRFIATLRRQTAKLIIKVKKLA